MRAVWDGADGFLWPQSSCSNSSPAPGILSFPPAKATKAFFAMEVWGSCCPSGLQRKARISLGNNCFRASWCHKAWIKPDGHLVQVGVRNNQFCVLEGEGKVLNSRYRDLSIKTHNIWYKPLGCGWFCGDLFPSAGRCWYWDVPLSCHWEDALWKARGFQWSRVLWQWKKHEVLLNFTGFKVWKILLWKA